eukprot:TRINITY_DN42_c0_g2_i3.p1 TRINITY_DN42_c0_g2~~TRINITY_DN42_c0_g2_i3.p1  ORF type:complete len:134 (-),score=16.97 TRINITY_DN42_c0_g2_i3:28-429(-)
MQQWKHLLWHLVKGIRKLPKWTGQLFRGIDRAHFNPEAYSKGSKVVWNSFSSCSKEEEQAKRFMKGNGVFFLIDSSEGRLVGNLSPFPQEEEVLLEPSSEFIVTASVEMNGSRIVSMKQTPSRRPVIPFPVCE